MGKADKKGGYTVVLRKVSLTARKAIMLNCQECMGFNANEVRRCTDQYCPLFPFRTADPTYSKPRKAKPASERTGSEPF